MSKSVSNLCSKFKFRAISEPLDVGTRIHWDEKTQGAYFVDVPKSTVYKYDFVKNETNKATVGTAPLAFMFPVEGSDSKFVAGLGRDLVFVEWDGISGTVSGTEKIAEVDTEYAVRDNRLNGAKVDPWGNLWAGTMGPPDNNGNTIPEKGMLYSLSKGTLRSHEKNIGISNGLAWNPSKNKMYYVDTLVPKVSQYDVSENGSTICNKTVVFDFHQNDVKGLPDGLTIDSEGNLWVCAIHGSNLVRFDPVSGKVLQRITLPTPQVTAVTFGGPNLDIMFVTTARIPVNGKVPPSPAGTTYMIENVGCIGYNGDRYIP